jgi:hypothetical protein
LPMLIPQVILAYREIIEPDEELCSGLDQFS